MKPFLLFTLLLVLSAYSVEGQISTKNIHESVLLQTKFCKGMVWEAKRSTAYPINGKIWTLTELKEPLDACTKKTIDWGPFGNRYLRFKIETDNSGCPLEDDINHTKAMYSISLQLYEHNGKLVHTLAHWGEIIGLDAERFVYIQEGTNGLFFSNSRGNKGSSISYQPMILRIDRFSQLLKFTAKMNH